MIKLFLDVYWNQSQQVGLQLTLDKPPTKITGCHTRKSTSLLNTTMPQPRYLGPIYICPPSVPLH